MTGLENTLTKASESCLVVGLDGVRLVFERGAFDKEATFMVTEALWFLSASILPYVFRDSITRVYYSFNDSATPFVIAFSSIVLKFILNILFITKWQMGIGGITLSTSLVTLFNACVLGFLMSKKMKMDYKSLFLNLFKMIAAGGVAFVVCMLAARGFDGYIQINQNFIHIHCMYGGLYSAQPDDENGLCLRTCRKN